uniref:EpsG family protein n=1 Tax=Erysipelothrix tonsillarum TaxID=38402 RepID=A0A6S6I6D7_9FIRM|nr:EpsG family protein [Erysipelothrix tonsillarum]
MYYFALIFPIVLYFLPKISTRTKYILALIPMFIIIALRFGHGPDYFAYEFYYNSLNTDTLGQLVDHQKQIELGFRLLEYPFIHFGLSFHTFIASLGSILLAIYSFWIYKSSDDPLLSLIIFYGMFFNVWVLSALRQSIVIALVLVLLFRKDKKLEPWKKIFVILILTFFHKSALYIIPFLVLLKFNWNRKRLLVVLGIALLTTFIPFEAILTHFDSIAIIKKSLGYLRTTYGFFDFPSIVRLIFIVVVLYHYNEITKTEYQKYTVNAFVLGLSSYFVLKFSELTASRSTIYFLMLFVIIIPWVVECYSSKQRQKQAVIIVTLLFSVVYLQKELRATERQSGFTNTSHGLVQMRTIFKPDYSQFDERSAFYTYHRELCKIEAEENRTLLDKQREFVGYQDDKSNIVVYDKSKKMYGIINEDGNWVVEPEFKRKPTLYKNVATFGKQGEVFRQRDYVDISQSDMDYETMRKIANVELSRQDQLIDATETKYEFSYDLLPEEIRQQFPNKENLSGFKLVSLDIPNKYYIGKFKYYDFDMTIYLDEAMQLITDDVFRTATRFDENGMITAYTYCSKVIYNDQNELIWIE